MHLHVHFLACRLSFNKKIFTTGFSKCPDLISGLHGHLNQLTTTFCDEDNTCHFLFDNLKQKRLVSLTKQSGIACFKNSGGTLVENHCFMCNSCQLSLFMCMFYRKTQINWDLAPGTLKWSCFFPSGLHLKEKEENDK